jgi:hypothetical protein
MYHYDKLSRYDSCSELILRLSLDEANIRVTSLLPCELPHITIRPSASGYCVDSGLVFVVVLIVAIC